MMTNIDIRNSTVPALDKEIEQARKKYGQEKMLFRLGQSTNSSQLGKLKKYIARLITIRQEKVLLDS